MNGTTKAIAALIAAVFSTGVLRAGDASKIVVDGSTTVGPIAKAFAGYYMKLHPDVTITVSESGSGNGAKSLINAACDVATMSRPMKASEKKAAQDAGVLPIQNVVALDGIAMIVNPQNPVKNLTLDQIRKIYAGDIRNWKELGGPDQAIVMISRETNSGTYETFETKVLGGKKMTPKTEYANSNGAIRTRVMSTPPAIGYVGIAFTEGVKAVTVNDVAVSVETVLNNQYPIARPLYMYTNGRPKEGTPLYGFVNLSNTAEGKKIIAETGFVALADVK
ncbi:MAG: phosphate ABC transporter substrate-binding protein [bacterium]